MTTLAVLIAQKNEVDTQLRSYRIVSIRSRLVGAAVKELLMLDALLAAPYRRLDKIDDLLDVLEIKAAQLDGFIDTEEALG